METFGEISSISLGELAPGTHWIRGWMSPEACLDALKYTRYPLPRIESQSLGCPSRNLVAIQSVTSKFHF
jgi:hypothetical protein